MSKKINPWGKGLKENSKEVKLPKFIKTDQMDENGKPVLKKLWEKGKSKFLDIRLHDEGKTSINELIN